MNKADLKWACRSILLPSIIMVITVIIIAACATSRFITDTAQGTSEEKQAVVEDLIKTMTDEEKADMQREYCKLPLSARMVMRIEMMAVGVKVPITCASDLKPPDPEPVPNVDM